MEQTKLKLINFIINEASEEQIQGLEELLLTNKDINFALELILNKEGFNDYIKEIKEQD